jgi:SAD/SRA domain
VAEGYFGELAGASVGATWPYRDLLAASGVHRPNQGGICGTGASGAESIVVNGAYADEDSGDEILYTGAGGRDSDTGRQIADQTLDQPGNAGLVTSELEGIPVRVVRGYNGDPKYSPAGGFRYDGLYRASATRAALARMAACFGSFGSSACPLTKPRRTSHRRTFRQGTPNLTRRAESSLGSSAAPRCRVR